MRVGSRDGRVGVCAVVAIRIGITSLLGLVQLLVNNCL